MARREAVIPDKTLICAGEFFLDLIFFDLARLPELGEELKTDNFALSFGGGAAITASAAARLGRATRLLTVWGDSMLDRQTRSQLENTGVMCGNSLTVDNEMSGLAVAVSTREDRYFLTSPGANRHVESFLLESSAWSDYGEGVHVHLALTPTAWLPFADLVTALQEQGATVSWDLGWDPAAVQSPGFGRLSRRLDVLFMNDKEACHYTSASTPELALERLMADRTVVVKMGSRGAIAAGPGQPIVRARGIVIEAIDSVGAGDAFNGGFLDAWMQGADLQDCLRAGNVCGGLSTRAPGGTGALPDRPEFEKTLAAYRSYAGGTP